MFKKLFGISESKTPIDTVSSIPGAPISLADDIREKVSKISDPEILQINKQIGRYANTEGNLDNVAQSNIFGSIVVPILGIDQACMQHHARVAALHTFLRLVDTRVDQIVNRKNGVPLIDEELTSRLSRLSGYGVVLSHIEDSNKLMQNGFVNSGYSELMKGFEKLLKKMCLIHYKEEYQKEIKELPINAKMEDILKFLRKLGWNDRQYIKPIDALNKFANDDKHAISHRGDINQVQPYDYNGVLNFILDYIESHKQLQEKT